MAGAYKRKSDKARGKDGKWTGWFINAEGKKEQFVGTTDKATTLELARRKEAEAKLIRDGMIDPTTRARREASNRSPASHVEDYRDALLAKGDTPKHAQHVASALKSLLESAAIVTVADLAIDRVQEALARLRLNRSARTANFTLGAFKAWCAWLADVNRIAEPPRGLGQLRPYNQEVDRRRVRRALTGLELAKLLKATEDGPTIVATRTKRGGKPSAWLTGPDRSMLYRIVMGTGFRANELRTLTPEAFRLDGDEPVIVVFAAYSKHRREDRQPIPRELAAALRPWLASKPSDQPVLAVPEKTAAMLRDDLARAGIAYRDSRGAVIDFHALRGSYITDLIRRGHNARVVQKLARHSTVTLTLEKYTYADDADMRAAIEGKPGTTNEESRSAPISPDHDSPASGDPGKRQSESTQDEQG
jgi:integrase/recombinase XerD